MTNFDQLSIWNDKNLADSLYWYYNVSLNRLPAKYLIANKIPYDKGTDSSLKELFNLHNMLTKDFLELWKQIKSKKKYLDDIKTPKTSLVDLTTEIAHKMLYSCIFCEWKCKVDRSYTIDQNISENDNKSPKKQKRKLGTCQLDNISRVGSYFHHFGEEIIYRGTKGSGTIFFTSCNQRCGFCQNGDISRDKNNGIVANSDDIAYMSMQLRFEGVHNINFVGGEPTIHLHNIIEAISKLRLTSGQLNVNTNIIKNKSDYFRKFSIEKQNATYGEWFNVPILWNSNFFMSEESMQLLRPLIDIWLPDFKFGPNKDCAIRLSRTPRYYETVTRNLKLLDSWEEEYSIRHLVMPDHVECCTKPILDWIKENIPTALVNVMDQYHPDCFANQNSKLFNPKLTDISRYPTREEIINSFEYAKKKRIRFEELTFEKNRTGITI
ncbi:MAG: radical SAM protein [Candidatus Thorarchaeota archaeon]